MDVAAVTDVVVTDSISCDREISRRVRMGIESEPAPTDSIHAKIGHCREAPVRTRPVDSSA